MTMMDPIQYVLENRSLRLCEQANELRGIVAMLGWLTVNGRIDVCSARNSLRDCVTVLDGMIEESERDNLPAPVPFETGVSV